MSPSARTLLPLLLIALSAQTIESQQKTSVAFTVGPGSVRFSNFGSRTITMVAQVSVTRDVAKRTAAELSAFTAVPLQVMSVTPGCLPNSLCQSRTTPSALVGGLASALLQMGDSPLRLSAGVGRLGARGMEGPGAVATNVFQLGLEWSQEREGGMRMTAGTRAIQFATPVSGARQLILSGVGLRF